MQAASLISGGRLQLGISRGSPEQVIDGWRYFGYVPGEGENESDMARRHTEVLLDALRGGFAKPNPQPMFPNPPGLLRRALFCRAARANLVGRRFECDGRWAAKLGMNLQSSTLKDDETGEDRSIFSRRSRSAPIARPGQKRAIRARLAFRSAAAFSR